MESSVEAEKVQAVLVDQAVEDVQCLKGQAKGQAVHDVDDEGAQNCTAGHRVGVLEEGRLADQYGEEGVSGDELLNAGVFTFQKVGQEKEATSDEGVVEHLQTLKEDESIEQAWNFQFQFSTVIVAD